MVSWSGMGMSVHDSGIGRQQDSGEGSIAGCRQINFCIG